MRHVEEEASDQQPANEHRHGGHLQLGVAIGGERAVRLDGGGGARLGVLLLPLSDGHQHHHSQQRELLRHDLVDRPLALDQEADRHVGE